MKTRRDSERTRVTREKEVLGSRCPASCFPPPFLFSFRLRETKRSVAGTFRVNFTMQRRPKITVPRLPASRWVSLDNGLDDDRRVRIVSLSLLGKKNKRSRVRVETHPSTLRFLSPACGGLGRTRRCSFDSCVRTIVTTNSFARGLINTRGKIG